jgi:putative endonuclease
MDEECCVYIMTNSHNTVLYSGVTSDLKKRAWDHKTGVGSTFASRYRTTKLVYYEVTPSITSAILREKQIKGGSRKKKVDLIDGMNPSWRDLSETL